LENLRKAFFYLMTNYLSKLLGFALRRMRTPGVSSAAVASLLKIHDSKYRLIEAGGQILDPELTIPLKSIPVFKDVQADKLSLFITYSYYLQESINRMKRDSSYKDTPGNNDNPVAQAILALIEFDKDVELFLDTNILQETSFDYDRATTNVILFLKSKPTALNDEQKIGFLRKQLIEIEEATLCVFNPLIKSSINTINKDLDRLGMFKSVNDQIADLTEKIKGIKDLKLGFDTINAPEFIKVHKYQEVKGIISNPQNLLDTEIITDYSSYMKQVWLPSLKSIKFIFLSEDEDTLMQIVSKYRNEKMYALYEQEYNRKKDDEFRNGIKKIEFKCISKKHDLIRTLLADHDEFWFYHSIDNDGKDFKDGIEYGFMTYSINKEIDPNNFKYEILTNKEVQESNRAFDLVWNAASHVM